MASKFDKEDIADLVYEASQYVSGLCEENDHLKYFLATAIGHINEMSSAASRITGEPRSVKSYMEKVDQYFPDHDKWLSEEEN